MLRTLVCAGGFSAAFCLFGAAAPPKSAPAQKAAEEYQSTLVKLDEDFQKGSEPLKAEYVKALNEARKVALEKNDLDESQRIAAATKAADTVTAPVQAVAVRQRLAGTTWEWSDEKTTVTLNADGTLAASWMPNDKGHWHVNPDLTVVWWSTGHPWASVMKFNANYTAHESHVPKEDVSRTGKRVK